jgi:hypothetical protein
MSFSSIWSAHDSQGPAGASVTAEEQDHRPDFEPLTVSDIQAAFAVPSTYPPILSLIEAAGLVKLRPQTLKRKVSEGLFSSCVVRGKPLRFWRDRLVAEVMS